MEYHSGADNDKRGNDNVEYHSGADNDEWGNDNVEYHSGDDNDQRGNDNVEYHSGDDNDQRGNDNVEYHKCVIKSVTLFQAPFVKYFCVNFQFTFSSRRFNDSCEGSSGTSLISIR